MAGLLPLASAGAAFPGQPGAGPGKASSCAPAPAWWMEIWLPPRGRLRLAHLCPRSLLEKKSPAASQRPFPAGSSPGKSCPPHTLGGEVTLGDTCGGWVCQWEPSSLVFSPGGGGALSRPHPEKCLQRRGVFLFLQVVPLASSGTSQPQGSYHYCCPQSSSAQRNFCHSGNVLYPCCPA